MLRVEHCLVGNQWQQDCVIGWDKQGIINELRATTPGDRQLPLAIGRLVPGFIDVQVNGGGGVLFNQEPEVAALSRMFAAHHRHGTTAMLPTLITDKLTVMEKAAECIAKALEQNTAGVVGIHFEGPNLSTARKGVHKADYIHTPSDAELALYTRKDLGVVVITVAPETMPANIIADLVKQGVRVCLGHSNTNEDTVQRALEAGATGFTHLFNAMSPLQSREPGMVGAALADEASYCGLILDHYHVHPTASKLAIKAKGTDKIMLVTDAMAHVGVDVSALPFFDTVISRNGNKLTTPDGTLAGSCLDMLTAVQNAHNDLGVPLTDAIKMASKTPADFIGISNIGELALGKRADMLLLDDRMEISASYLAGEESYQVQTKQ